MMGNFGFQNSGSSGGGGTGAVGREQFIATANQTVFTTTITLTDSVSIFIEGALQSETLYARSGNTITFVIGVREGNEVVIIN